MSITGFNLISASLTGLTDIVCDNLTAQTITLPSGDLQTTLDNIETTAGPTGATGAQGESVSFFVPYINTGNAGTSAQIADTITVVDNVQYHQLTFTIPRGDAGTDGTNGTNGTNGTDGTDGTNGQSVSFNTPTILTGAAGTDASITDTITTVSGVQTHDLQFTIPRGSQGAQGNQGAQGDQGGKGDTGDTGAKGDKGDAGDSTAATAAAIAAGVSAAAAVVSSAASAASSAASAASSASSAASAASAEASAETALERTQYIRTGGSFPTGYTTFYGTGSAEGIRFYNNDADVTVNLSIKNNGDIEQTTGTTKLVNLEVSGTSTGIERLLIDDLDTNTQFCIPFTRDIDIDDVTPLNTRMAVDTTFNFNPSTNMLSVPNITGTCSKVLAAASVLNSDLAVPFLSASTGSVDVLTDIVNGITYNPSTNILTCVNFSGTTSNVNITEVNTNSNFRVPFLSGNSGSQTISSDEDILYNPFTTVLSIPSLKTENIISTTSTLNIGDATNTSTINIEGNSGCSINIGVASFLNNINVGNNLSNVTIKCITDTAITVFNPLDQMNGVF